MYKDKLNANTKNMIMLIIFIFLLFIPIGIRVIYDDNYSDIDVFIFRFLKYKFDLDSFIRKYIIEENNKISLPLIVNNLILLINSKSLIRDLCKTIKVKKSTVILKRDFDNYLSFIFFWNIVSRYTYIIRKSFKKVENEYYMMSNQKNDVSLELIFNITLFNVLIVLLKNIKETVKVIKLRRRQKKNGTSNL